MASTSASRSSAPTDVTAIDGPDAPVYVRPRSFRSAPGDAKDRSAADLAARGRRAALEAFYGDLFTLDGDAAAAMQRVVSGTAPQAFKDGFCETLTTLSAMFDQKI